MLFKGPTTKLTFLEEDKEPYIIDAVKALVNIRYSKDKSTLPPNATVLRNYSQGGAEPGNWVDITAYTLPYEEMVDNQNLIICAGYCFYSLEGVYLKVNSKNLTLVLAPEENESTLHITTQEELDTKVAKKLAAKERKEQLSKLVTVNTSDKFYREMGIQVNGEWFSGEGSLPDEAKEQLTPEQRKTINNMRSGVVLVINPDGTVTVNLE